MGPLREYHVVMNGAPTTVLLTDEDAARLGATPVAQEPATAPAPEAKARRPANKARTPKDKTGG